MTRKPQESCSSCGVLYVTSIGQSSAGKKNCRPELGSGPITWPNGLETYSRYFRDGTLVIGAEMNSARHGFLSILLVVPKCPDRSRVSPAHSGVEGSTKG
jgi:hypothetical protein